jgi:hypothetical protein
MCQIPSADNPEFAVVLENLDDKHVGIEGEFVCDEVDECIGGG